MEQDDCLRINFDHFSCKLYFSRQVWQYKNWLKLKIKPQYENQPCLNEWNILCVCTFILVAQFFFISTSTSFTNKVSSDECPFCFFFVLYSFWINIQFKTNTNAFFDLNLVLNQQKSLVKYILSQFWIKTRFGPVMKLTTNFKFINSKLSKGRLEAPSTPSVRYRCWKIYL